MASGSDEPTDHDTTRNGRERGGEPEAPISGDPPNQGGGTEDDRNLEPGRSEMKRSEAAPDQNGEGQDDVA
jgi:hypothetical protein